VYPATGVDANSDGNEATNPVTANVWADEQSQVLHRLPLGVENKNRTVWVGTPSGIVDARDASDLIKKLAGKAYWRKLFVRRDRADARGVLWHGLADRRRHAALTILNLGDG